MKRYLFAAIALAIAVIAGIIFSFFYPVFKVQNFSITGTTHYSVFEIEKASDIAVGDNLLRVNAHKAAENIVSLPWLASAHVDRQFPNTVTIDVVERVAVLYNEQADGAHIIDDQGIAFTIDQPPLGIPFVVGMDTDDQSRYQDIIFILNSLDPQTRSTVISVESPDPYALTLVTSDGHRFYWGSTDKADQKAVAMRMLATRVESQWNISNPALVTTP